MARLMPFVSVAILAFGIGVFVTEYKYPPYRTIFDGAKTLLYAYRSIGAPPYIGQFVGASDIPANDAPTARLLAAAEGQPEAPILVTGGLHEYLEVCPGDGCIAVEIDRAGKVLHGYPYKPDEILAADITGGSFYREAMPADARLIKRPIGMRPMPDGDLIVSFQTTGNMFPFAGGLARIGRDGTPRWYRFDYSHHWVNMLPDGRILVPDLTVEDGDWVVPLGPKGDKSNQFCETGRPQVDGLHILDAETGEQLQRIDVNAALRASPWQGMLSETFNPCDPLHINYVDMLDETAPGGALAPGHLIVSLRNLSAVIVLDPATDQVTKFIRGSFQQQHAVQQTVGSKAVMFDNWGAAANGGGSRLLEIDLAGGPERQIYPPADAPAPELYSHRAGHVGVSPDNSRAFVSFSEASIGVEVDLSNGEELMRYFSVHDLSGVAGIEETYRTQAARAKLFGMYYSNP